MKNSEHNMKVLVVSNMFPNKENPSYGVFVKNFCDQLELLGISYRLSVMYKSKNKFLKIFNYMKFFLTTYFKCLFGKYDIVYVHYASHSSIPVLWAKKLKKLCIYTNVHGSDVVPENVSQKQMQKYTEEILKCSEKIIVPSNYFKNYIVKKYCLEKECIYTVHSGGVDKKVFYENANQKKEKDVLKIGYVGRISQGKGWDTLLNACALLENITYRLVIVGNGPEEEKLQKKISELGMAMYIEKYDLLPQAELRNLYNQMDVFVFPTEREGESLGLVALEAMACGVPVIASDFAAPKDYVIENVNGLKFKKGNAEELKNAINKFATLSFEKRDAMSKQAKSTSEEYAVEKILEQMQAIFVERENGKEG